MIKSLRQHQFDTVLGPIDFDEKGDFTVQNPVFGTFGEERWLHPAESRESRQTSTGATQSISSS